MSMQSQLLRYFAAEKAESVGIGLVLLSAPVSVTVTPLQAGSGMP